MTERLRLEDLVRSWVSKAEHDLLNIDDLTGLYALFPKELRLPIDPRLLDQLNPYAIEGRYPGVWEPVERDEALRAVDAARVVREAVRVTLPPACLG